MYDLTKLRFVTLYTVNRLDIRIKETVNRSDRPRFALCCKTQGRTVYRSGGARIVSDRDHIVLLPKGCSYTISYEELGECFLIEFGLPDDIVISDIQSVEVSNSLEIQSIFRRMERLWVLKKDAYYHKCMAGLYEILAILEEAGNVSYQFSSKYSLIAPALEYLETNFGDGSLDVDKLAEISGISTVYFRKIFTGIFHMPPAKYLQNLRIEKAKELFLSDYPSVGAVAATVGFRNIYHFCKTFKKATECTPSEYAKSVCRSL